MDMSYLYAPYFEPAKTLYFALAKEMGKRKTYSDMEWLENEPKMLYEFANQLAFDNPAKYRPISMEDVEKANIHASGHSDYTMKFVLGVAEKMLRI